MSLKHAILGFLSFKPLSGYDLKKAFDNSVQHFWPANQSQIYRTLAELDEQGHITKEVIPREERLDMKIYSITESGRTELHRWLSTPLPPQDTREPFLIQLFFGGRLNDSELLNLLQQELKSVEERLVVYTTIYATTVEQATHISDPRPFFLSLLTLEYGLVSHQTYVEWLRGVIERIQTKNYSPTGIS
jgi:DNA-binding PadR family transcriptional regulator